MNKKNKILVYLKILIFQNVLSQSEVYVKVGSNYQFIANNNLLLYKEDELESVYDKLKIFSKGINNKLGDLENQLPPQLCPYSQILYHQSELCKTSATEIFNAYERYANSYLSKTSKGLDIKKPPNCETGGFEY